MQQDNAAALTNPCALEGRMPLNRKSIAMLWLLARGPSSLSFPAYPA